MKPILFLSLFIFNVSYAVNKTEGEIPYCADLDAETLYRDSSAGGGWGEPDCWAGDEVVKSYVSRAMVLKIEPHGGFNQCWVQKGEYLWSCQRTF